MDLRVLGGSPQPVALVTGAARRLGRLIALELARAGWNVAIHCRAVDQDALDTLASIQAMGCRAGVFSADLSEEAEVDHLWASVKAELGTVAVLVNSASLFEHDRPENFSWQGLVRHFGPNLAAPVRLSQRLFEGLRAENSGPASGIVINILDQKLENLNPDFFSYTLTKAALAAATTMMAQALAPTVRVVGVAPGLTLPSYLQTEEAFLAAQKLSPLGASSQPEEITDAVLFAVRNRALTGTVITVDGGQHLMGFARDFSYLSGDGSAEPRV